MTGFDKTGLTHTKTEIHFIAQHESHTPALSRHTIDGAIDGQVCFHRWSFANPVNPRWSTTGSMGLLMGITKAAWGVKLLLTTVLYACYQVDCSSFCALLETQHCCLPTCEWFCPASAFHPPPMPIPPPPTHPPSIYFIPDIARVEKNYHKNQQCYLCD